MNMHVAQPVIAPSANGPLLSIEELASHTFQPWTEGREMSRENGMPSEKDMADTLTWLRIAWQLMFQSRDQMSARLSEIALDDLKDLIDGLQGTADIMECMQELANGAKARILVAVSASEVAKSSNAVAQ